MMFQRKLNVRPSTIKLQAEGNITSKLIDTKWWFSRINTVLETWTSEDRNRIYNMIKLVEQQKKKV
jgi:hypothetical protein